MQLQLEVVDLELVVLIQYFQQSHLQVVVEQERLDVVMVKQVVLVLVL
jgi:hypothetical protein